MTQNNLTTLGEPASLAASQGGSSAAPVTGERDNDAQREAIYVDVLNTGSCAVRVRSLTHFFEADRTLKFDRAAAFGMRLDRPCGSVVRFESGEIARVRLVRMSRPTALAPEWRSVGHRPGGVKQRRLRT